MSRGTEVSRVVVQPARELGVLSLKTLQRLPVSACGCGAELLNDGHVLVHSGDPALASLRLPFGRTLQVERICRLDMSSRYIAAEWVRRAGRARLFI
jgi:hypothetical protein